MTSVVTWVFSPCPSPFCGLLTVRLPNEPALTPLIFIVDFIFSAQQMLALVFIPFFYFPLVLIHSSFKKIPKVKNSVIDLDLGVFSKEAPSSVDLSLVFYFVGC